MCLCICLATTIKAMHVRGSGEHGRGGRGGNDVNTALMCMRFSTTDTESLTESPGHQPEALAGTVLLFFETGSQVAQVSLALHMWPRMSLSS